MAMKNPLGQTYMYISRKSADDVLKSEDLNQETKKLILEEFLIYERLSEGLITPSPWKN